MPRTLFNPFESSHRREPYPLTVEESTDKLWKFIGKSICEREDRRGEFTDPSSMQRLYEKFHKDYLKKCDAEDLTYPWCPGASHHGTLEMLVDYAYWKEGDKFLCLYSVNKNFTAGKSYRLDSTSKGLHLVTDEGRVLAINSNWARRYSKTFFKKIQNYKTKNPETEQVKPGFLDQVFKEHTMCLSQKGINRLNGLKVGEEKLVELTQESSERKTKTFDLVKLLQKTNVIKDLKPGEDCLVEAVDIHGDQLKLTVLEGQVEKEQTQIVLANLQEMILQKEN